MLAGDIDLDDGGIGGRVVTNGFSHGLVTEDVLLCKSLTSQHHHTHGAHCSTFQPHHQKQQSQDQGGTSGLLGICSSYSGVSSGQQQQQQIHITNPVRAPMEQGVSPVSEKELQRREKLRERKRVQRQNQDFAERERLRARGRIKALREDPVFRQYERQRDKERRRKARLLNQSQRKQERDRDKLRKSLMRSMVNQNKTDNLDKGGNYSVVESSSHS